MFAQAWTGVSNNPNAGMSTGALTTVSGNTICVGVLSNSFNNIADGDVTDSKGNNYTRLATLYTIATRTGAMFYCENIIGGADHTITFTRPGASFGEIVAVELNNMEASSFDISSNTGNAPLAADPWNTTPATTTEIDTICAVFCSDGSPTFSAGTGYTVRSTAAITMLETKDSASIGNNDAEASGGSSLGYIGFLGAFKEISAPSGSSWNYRAQLQ